MADTQNIVLGSDSETFWREGDTWTDDPSEAKSFDNPREAWQQAVRLQSDQAKYLEDSPVELHLSEIRMSHALPIVSPRSRRRTTDPRFGASGEPTSERIRIGDDALGSRS